MERVVDVAIYEATPAPPMGPITIQTSEPRFETATNTTRGVRWGHFEVEEVVQVRILMA